ncbi:DUF2064 domain-containing protein [Streptomyces albus subsp. chlorinus]|uniref:TIGR04282 family arsenosugar biosynthesis glycosyltransferase n=1 Tax=Streptomyces albus TaxID=1888 RepID=UPI00156E154B|nr:DUF2064 domain-containing protein [Streptomyces albus]NSC24960.1 DUF2064 domain-containing protein [Streptomyces albus subsp. chlorinus]
MPHPSRTTLLVIAKEPRPGRAKTRLGPVFTEHGAASLASAALTDTLRAVLATPARRRVLVLDGRPGPWLPGPDEGGDTLEIAPQAAGGLDARLAAAFALCDGPALLVGMDTPQLTPGLLAPATAPHAWRDHDAFFGPAADGGFWALGLARPDPALLRGVPMSTPTTGAVQRARLVDAGLRVCDLPELRDVDEPDDAAAVAARAPGTLFAAEHARLRGLLDRAPAPTAPGTAGDSPGAPGTAGA